MADEELYKLMEDMGDVRVHERFQELMRNGALSQTRPGSRLIAESAGRVLVALKAHIQAVKDSKRKSVRSKRILEIFELLPAEKCVALCVRYMLDRLANTVDSSYKSRCVGAMRTQLGNMLKEEADFVVLSRQSPKLYGYLRNRTQGGGASRRNSKSRLADAAEQKACDWTREDCSLIGGLLQDYIMRFSDLFRVEMEMEVPLRGRTKKLMVIKVRDEVFDWLSESVNFMRATNPANLPITERPYDWGPNDIGGYPGRPQSPIDMMTTKRKSQYLTFLKSDCPDVYRGLNTIQSTGWRINRRVFDVFQVALRYEWDTIGLSPSPPPKPTAPEHDWKAGDPDWLEFKRKKVEWQHMTRHYVGDRVAAVRTNAVGEVYVDLEKFYYPHQIDYRGRCYPVGTPISYQGPDWQRGLLEFADGKPIGAGLRWFLIHGANCFGEDKQPYDGRVDWVAENHRNIVETADDPLTARWWTEADKPFQFLAWAMEYREAMQLDDPRDYVSHIAVNMDGSNNGLQIYSLITRDPDGCAATNCLPTETPADAYQKVADKLTAKLKELVSDPATDPKYARRARRLLNFLDMQGFSTFPRSAVKRPVMTQPYGATMYSCQKYLVEWYHDYVRGKNLRGDAAPFPEGDAYKIFQWVGSLTWDIIGEVNPKAREAMAWLRDVSDVLSKHGEHFEWTTPLGMRCEQRYIKGQIRNITLKAFKPVRLRIWEDDNKIDALRSRNGICPNFIHSFDAAAMFLTVCRASEEGVTHYQMIHDSFGTHAADAPTMARVLRESYVQILRGDPLTALRDALHSVLPEGVELPAAPVQGDVNVEDLQEAKYFFS